MVVKSTQLVGVALVVGGGSGIGQQSAYSLAEAGARAIVFADKNGETAASSAEESKKYATNPEYQSAHFVVDVCDKDGVDAMVDFVVKTFGQLDYAVNSAGIGNGPLNPVSDADVDRYDLIHNINARGMFLCCRAEAAAMRKNPSRSFEGRNGWRDIGRGAIVNVGSGNSVVGIPGKVGYTSAKHACAGITKVVGLDHSAEGIRCNMVCPIWVSTPMLDLEISGNPKLQHVINAIVPIKRAANGEEIGDSIAYLLSPAASYVNAATLVLDAATGATVRAF